MPLVFCVRRDMGCTATSRSHIRFDEGVSALSRPLFCASRLMRVCHIVFSFTHRVRWGPPQPHLPFTPNYSHPHQPLASRTPTTRTNARFTPYNGYLRHGVPRHPSSVLRSCGYSILLSTQQFLVSSGSKPNQKNLFPLWMFVHNVLKHSLRRGASFKPLSGTLRPSG